MLNCERMLPIKLFAEDQEAAGRARDLLWLMQGKGGVGVFYPLQDGTASI